MHNTTKTKQKTISEYYMLGPKIELIWTEELIAKYASRRSRDKIAFKIFSYIDSNYFYDITDFPSSMNEHELSEDEALQLAEELRSRLNDGEILEADQTSLQRMVAGLGDKRGSLRLTFAKSLGSLGDEAIPILCHALRHHENVVVRRASAKTLNIIGSKKALPFLLDAFKHDQDPVVLGSSAGAMATIGPDAMDDLFEILIHPDSTAFQVGLINLALSFIGSKAPEAILKAADSPHAEIRVAAIAALGEQIQALDDAMAKDRLIQALNDISSEVRAEAATLIGEYGSRLSHLEGFIGHAEQCNVRVRRYGKKNVAYGKPAGEKI